jgi:hypothetical protein
MPSHCPIANGVIRAQIRVLVSSLKEKIPVLGGNPPTLHCVMSLEVRNAS